MQTIIIILLHLIIYRHHLEMAVSAIKLYYLQKDDNEPGLEWCIVIL